MGYKIGLTPDTIWTTSFYSFSRMLEAWWEKEQTKQAYIRRHASLIMSTQVGKKDQSKVKPQNIWPLPTDTTTVDVSKKAIEEGRKDFKKRIERLKRSGVLDN